MAIDYIRWTSKITQRQRFSILPDGCQDILLRTRRPTATLTQRDMQPRYVTLPPGDHIVGFRMRPGCTVDTCDLAQVDSEEAAQQLIRHACTSNVDINAAIQTLGASNAPVGNIATQLGVSLRTLQRHFQKLTLPSPEFWRLLGRARRTAIALSHDGSLADLAGCYGYSDQAHMTRACAYWFGSTPYQIKQDPGLRDAISQPGLGTWTGEQISTR